MSRAILCQAQPKILSLDAEANAAYFSGIFLPPGWGRLMIQRQLFSLVVLMKELGKSPVGSFLPSQFRLLIHPQSMENFRRRGKEKGGRERAGGEIKRGLEELRILILDCLVSREINCFVGITSKS